MKRFTVLALGSILMALAGARAADDLGEASKLARLDYIERLRLASEDLNRVRERIAQEKAPFLRELRTAEERIVAADSQIARLEVGQEQAGNERRKLMRNLEAIRKNSTFLVTLAHDSLKALDDGLAPGEEPPMRERLIAMRQRLDESTKAPPTSVAIDVVELIADRTLRQIGGYEALGEALFSDHNDVVKGTFVFVGPETFFRNDARDSVGIVRVRDASGPPIAYRLSDWKVADATRFFDGQLGAMPADPTGGKALRLRETSGTFWQHVQKGGVVAIAILFVGCVALGIVILKLRELARMGVESWARARTFLEKLSAGDRRGAEAMLPELRPSTRELFETGLRYRDEPKELLEERLQAVLLGQRLVFERRLPLLAVIATASPLMGLLGTVVGMVKTFTLITVFGTGNAGKLSSGISEVLVATELGLAVAIPTLVVHGFLAHRVHKHLALLERQALEFVTATQIARVDASAAQLKAVTTA